LQDRADRAARLQLIGRMLAGQSWQTAAAESHLPISRATAYRLVQQARNEDKAPQIFLDDRHGHPYKVTEEVASLDQRGVQREPTDAFEPGST
jgi:hypothetical protein